MSGALGLSIPFGLYIARMISFETRPLEKTVAKVERGFFKLIGINIDKEMTSKEYFCALALTTIISIIFVTKEQLEEFESLTKFLTEEEKAGYDINGSDKGMFHNMLVKLAQSGEQVKILKGSVDAMLNLSEGHVNEAEVKWKSQQISKEGETPLLVSINQEVIGLIALKDNLKENIRENIGEIRATGIHTIMITGDTQLTAQVIAREANVDEIMAEAKPTDKLRRVEEEQLKGHIIGMVGDGTNDAPGLAKADVGLAMNSGTAAGKGSC